MKKLVLKKRTVANLSSAQMSEVQGASYAETDCMGSFGCTNICVSNNGCPSQGCPPIPEETYVLCTVSCPQETEECPSVTCVVYTAICK